MRNVMVEVKRFCTIARSRECVAALGLAVALAWAAAATAESTASEQQAFATPQEAIDALVAAVRADDAAAQLLRILGPESDSLVRSGDPIADARARKRFVAANDEANKILMETDERAVLVIGNREWPFPIPLVKQGETWRFDTAAGAEEILNRRIGRNELGAIAVCRAHVDAQREYAAKDRNGDGILEYASRFRSSPGQRDGLYWPVEPGEETSPMGPLMASAQAEGYFTQQLPGHERQPYHGYYYRILTRQGEDAPGGAYDYVVKDRMIGGFALVAFPAKYGASGIMTFIVNHEGVVYQNDLGPDTGAIARQMTDFNPDTNWKRVPEPVSK